MMRKLPPRAPAMAAQDLSWAALDLGSSWDFVDFCAAKRKAHRETVDVDSRGSTGSGGGEFEDDAQLIMSMFNNEPITIKEGSFSGGSVSTSTSYQKRRSHPPLLPGVKIEHQEAESAAFQDEEGTTTVSQAAGSQQAVSDPKRVKRILANRQSARRSRVRKLQYISELERNLTKLQMEVSMVSPRVAYLGHQRMILKDDNSALKNKIAALAQHNLFKDAHQEALKREIERLKQVYEQQQNIHKATPPVSSPP